MRKPSRKTVKNKLDKLFSQKIRSRGYCERCGTTRTLQTSHIYSRSYLRLRWLEENACCLCAGCHFWWHACPSEAIEWVKDFKDLEKLKEIKRTITPVKTQEMRDWLEKLK